MEEQRIAKAHKLVVNNRKTSTVTGVLDVLSFDLNEILLETEQGMLMVKGTDLHVNRLTVEKGEVDLSGNIDSIAYSSVTPQAKQGGSRSGGSLSCTCLFSEACSSQRLGGQSGGFYLLACCEHLYFSENV